MITFGLVLLLGTFLVVAYGQCRPGMNEVRLNYGERDTFQINGAPAEVLKGADMDPFLPVNCGCISIRPTYALIMDVMKICVFVNNTNQLNMSFNSNGGIGFQHQYSISNPDWKRRCYFGTQNDVETVSICLSNDNGEPAYIKGVFGDVCLDPCSGNECVNGYCVPQNGSNFACECDCGFEEELCNVPNGETCIKDPCEVNPCQNGVCMPSEDAFSCDCDCGFEGFFCNITTEEPCPDIGPGTCSTCGYSRYEDAGTPGISTRIAEGWVARPHEFPYQVSYGNCGAVIINSFYVLTAAHCTIQSPRINEVVLGEHDKNNASNLNRLTIEMEEIINHPLYNASTFQHDIALFRLRTEIPTFDDFKYPACLPTQPHTDIKDEMIATGWGFTEKFARPTTLRAASIPVTLMEDCNQCFKKYVDKQYIKEVLPGMFCGGVCDNPMGATCQGDSGGPIVIKNKDGCFELVGLASWAVSCSRNTPSVFTDVYYYLDWITETIK